MLVRDIARFLALSVFACGALIGCPVILGVDGTFRLHDEDASVVSDDAASAPFCASLDAAPRFCDDFDGLELSAKWSTINVVQGGGVAVDTTLARSNPRSLRSWVEANHVGSGCDFPRVLTTLTEPARATHLGYAVRFGDDGPLPDGADTPHISAQSIGNGGDVCLAIVNLSRLTACGAGAGRRQPSPREGRRNPHGRAHRPGPAVGAD